MESHADGVIAMKRIEVDSDNTDNFKRLIPIDGQSEWLLDRLLFFVEAVVGYSFGMIVGACIGWILGWCTGNVYVEHFEPVYMDNLSELSRWRLMPYYFARNGAIVGVLAGAIMITIINSNLLSRRTASLYEKGVTEPRDIARLLGKNVRQIKKKINKLAKKGKIICQKARFSERFCACKANTY